MKKGILQRVSKNWEETKMGKYQSTQIGIDQKIITLRF